MFKPSALLLAALLALGGLAGPAAAGPADLALVPSDGTMLLHVDLARLRNSTLYKDVVSTVLNTPNAKQTIAKVKADVGFDPTTDLNSLTVVMPASAAAGSDEVLVIVQGKLDQGKLTALAQKEGKATKQNHNGVDFWAGKDGKQEIGMVFMGDRAAMGSAKLVRSLIDASKGKGKMNAKLAALAKQTNQKGDIWFAANVPEKARAELGKGNPMAKDLKTIRGSFDFAKGLNLNVAIGATPKTASAMAQMIMQALKGSEANNPMLVQMGIAPMIEKLKIAAKGSDLIASLDLNEADVGRLKMLAGMMAMGMGGGNKAPPPARPVPAPKK